MRYYLTPIRIAITKKKKKETNTVGENEERLKPLVPIGGSAKWYSHYWKEHGGTAVIEKNMKQNYHIIYLSNF